MDYLFWGFLLVFLDINIHFGVSTVDFLPSWLGYLLMIKGLDTLAEESERFAAARPWCVGMTVYTGVLWIADLFALGAELTFFTWLLGLAGTCVSFYITSIILDGIDRMQLRHGEIGAAGRGHRHDRRLSALDRAGDYGDLPAYFGRGEHCVPRPDACHTQGVERAENGRRDLNGGNRNFPLAKRGDL